MRSRRLSARTESKARSRVGRTAVTLLPALAVAAAVAVAIAAGGCVGPRTGSGAGSAVADRDGGVTGRDGGADLLQQIIRVRGCEVEQREGFLRLTGRSAGDRSMVQTIQEFATPLAIHLRARTNSTNIRLFYGAGQVIFNWEWREDELIVNDPLSGEENSARGEGWIGEMEWRDITWEIGLDRMRVLVDGEVRYQAAGVYEGLRNGVGVGPAWGSVVDVASLTVAPLE